MEQPLGTDSTFQMTLNDTGTVTQKTKSVENTVTAGSMYAVTIDNQTITSDELERIYGEVTALKDSATEENIYSTEYLGQYLSLAGKLYFAEVDVFDLESAEVYNVSVTRRLSEGITGYEAQKVSRYGVVTGLSYGSLYIDVDSDDHSAVSLNSEIDDSKAYLMSAGVMSSFYESAVWEQLTGYESVSTISIFRKAREENIEILQIAQDNLEEQLKNLNTDNKTKQDVRNAVNSGKSVVIPMNDVTIGDWTGTGYILLDETTGAASYMISGGLNGGEVPLELQLLVLASSFASASNAALLVDVLSKSIFAAMFPVMIYAVYASIILLVSIMIVDMYVSYYDYIMSGDTDAYFHTEELGMLLYFVAELELDASLFLYANFVLPFLVNDENEGDSSGEGTETGGGSDESGDIEANVEVDNAIIKDIIDNIPNHLKKRGKCDEFAQCFVDSLVKEGIDYKIIRVESKYYIYSNKAGMDIGRGYHYGVQIGDVVYDNMTTNGMLLDAWFDDLGIIQGVEGPVNWFYTDIIINK